MQRFQPRGFVSVDCSRESTPQFNRRTDVRFSLGLFNQKIAHHAHILMLKVVAMEHEQSLIVLKGLDDPHGFARHDQYSVL
jgi:hypothetical protein